MGKKKTPHGFQKLLCQNKLISCEFHLFHELFRVPAYKLHSHTLFQRSGQETWVPFLLSLLRKISNSQIQKVENRTNTYQRDTNCPNLQCEMGILFMLTKITTEICSNTKTTFTTQPFFPAKSRRWGRDQNCTQSSTCFLKA